MVGSLRGDVEVRVHRTNPYKSPNMRGECSDERVVTADQGRSNAERVHAEAGAERTGRDAAEGPAGTVRDDCVAMLVQVEVGGTPTITDAMLTQRELAGQILR